MSCTQRLAKKGFINQVIKVAPSVINYQSSANSIISQNEAVLISRMLFTIYFC